MAKNKTSIIFVNVNDKDGKAIKTPPTHVLLHWKKYLFLLFLFLTISFLFAGYYIYQKTGKYYTGIYKKEIQSAQAVKKAINLQEVENTFKSIDESITQINHFMKERGLTRLTLQNDLPDDSFNIININELAKEYDGELKNMEKLVKNTPMGKPHLGHITSTFGYRPNPFDGGNMEMHPGVDLAGNIGNPVRATAAGRVVFARRRGGYGNCVIVKHQHGLKTLYGHLSKILVKKGEEVNVGQVIGKLGSTGRSTGPHVHYEIINDGRKTDPLSSLTL